MLLSCPNCGATYELPDERLPTGGGHVQCAECHTRWFARRPQPAPVVATERPSEDEIIARLESRVGVRPAMAAPMGAGGETIAFPGPRRPQTAPPEPPAADPPRPPAAESAPAQPPMPPRPPAATATRPAPAQPAPAQPAPAPAAPAAAPTPLRPRPDRPTAPAPAALPQNPPRRGGALGFALAVLTSAIALGVYLGAEGLAARSPGAGPTLLAYAAGVDAARDWIEAALSPLRDRALPDA